MFNSLKKVLEEVCETTSVTVSFAERERAIDMLSKVSKCEWNSLQLASDPSFVLPAPEFFLTESIGAEDAVWLAETLNVEFGVNDFKVDEVLGTVSIFAPSAIKLNDGTVPHKKNDSFVLKA